MTEQKGKIVAHVYRAEEAPQGVRSERTARVVIGTRWVVVSDEGDLDALMAATDSIQENGRWYSDFLV
jgi:hypothetical protein